VPAVKNDIKQGLKVVLPPEAKGKPAPSLVMSYEGLQNAVIVDDAGVASNQFASHPSDAEIERGRVGSEHDTFTSSDVEILTPVRED
jgi:hypothetical protein